MTSYMTSDKDCCDLLIICKLRKLVENRELMFKGHFRQGICLYAGNASRSGYFSVQTLLPAPSAGGKEKKRKEKKTV